MELLNGVGEPISPEFNNQLIHQSGKKTAPPTWLKARLTEDELARLTGTPLIPAADLVPEAKAEPKVTAESVTESPNDDEVKPDSGTKRTPEATASPEAKPSPEIKTSPEAKPGQTSEKVEETDQGSIDPMESEPSPNLKTEALVDAQDKTDDTDQSDVEQAPDDVSEDNSDDLTPPAELIVLDDQAPAPNSDKPSMPVPSASEERLIPTSRLGGSARELLNEDGSLRKP
jgi:hypothetical protein